ncbi:glycosyltransferase [Aquabacterium sp.]|uniref:glycosyltransferase n=1 Tax=Aquabacterium sp. TaxID=1872578 RepID=UPI0025B962FF|nr:glycosyltransferase [Aquabacterium sp.]
MKPRVSFIVPSFNETPEVISESLRSVAKQTFTDFECIVVDESTDPARAQACERLCNEDPRFIYVKPKERLGLAASLNLALGMARADWVARFDSDDVCLPERIALQMAFLAEHPEVDVLGGGLEIIDEAGKNLAFRDYPVEHDVIARKLQFTTPLAHPTVIYRRRLVLEAGGYDPSFRFAEDLDLWLRLLNRKVRFANLPLTVVRYRQQRTRRQSQHWRFNLKARTKNFSAQMLVRRSIGIAVIGCWSLLPAPAQESVFKRLLLRRG